MMRRRLRSIAAGAVLLGSAGAVSVAGAIGDADRAEATTAPVVAAPVCFIDVTPARLSTMFDTEPGGVVGADYQRALALADGRVLWTFHDAAVRVGDRIEIVHNIAVVQDGTCFTVMYGGTRDAPRSFLFAGRTQRFERWFWPLDAEIGQGGRIHVFAAEMREEGPWYLTRTVPTGTWVAVLDPATLRVVDEVRPPDASAGLYGWSITSDHDWTYLYGHCYRQFGFDVYIFTAAFDRSCSTDVRVARVPRGRLLAEPTYWDGRVWQTDPTQAVSVVDGTGRRINANQFEWTGAGFVSVNKEGDWWGDTIYVSRSVAPTGPFEIHEAIRAPTKCAVECNSFFASWVPSAAVDRAPGELVYSLSHNRWDGVITSLYRPTYGSVAAPEVVPAGGTLELAVDPDAATVAITVTAVEPASSGFVTAYPCAAGRPFTSNVNHFGEPVVANLVLVRPDEHGRVCLFSLAPTDLVVDLAAEFDEADGVLAAERPYRVADTRVGTGVRRGPILPGDVLRLPVPAVPPDAAVALNVAAVDPRGAGYLTLHDCDVATPSTSNVNVGNEPAVSNLVVVEPSASGEVCVYSHGAVDLVVDVVGIVTAGSFDRAVRLADTRAAPEDRLTAGGVLEIVVPGDDPTALLNVVAVEPDAPGFLTVFPCASQRPVASNLNHAVAPVVANLAIAAPAADRRVCVFTMSATDVVVDFVGGIAAETSVPVPVRLVDSRDGTGLPGQLGGGRPTLR